jgi:xanthine/CO dehydrogenase XdhC/CoxF family maturation factor
MGGYRLCSGIVASTRTKGFDWRAFWAMWEGFEGDKLAYLAMMASDADHELTGDWLEAWLRAEIARRRAALP